MKINNLTKSIYGENVPEKYRMRRWHTLWKNAVGCKKYYTGNYARNEDLKLETMLEMRI